MNTLALFAPCELDGLPVLPMARDYRIALPPAARKKIIDRIMGGEEVQ